MRRNNALAATIARENHYNQLILINYTVLRNTEDASKWME